MAAGQVGFQALRTMPRAAAVTSHLRTPVALCSQRATDKPTTSLYRGIRDNFEFFTPQTAERLKMLQDKWDRSLEPTFLDRFLKTVTRRPYLLPAEAREFEKLRAVACPQSFSDNESIAVSYAGDKGYLLKLSMPLFESWKFMESRSLMVNGYVLQTDVYFVPSTFITRNVSNGDWTLTIMHLGHGN